MAEKKAMTSLFKLCTSLQNEVAELRAEIRELRESRETFIPRPVAESVLTLTNGVNDAIDYTEKEIARLETDLSEVREHVEAGEKWRKIAVERVIALEANVFRGRANTVKPEGDHRRQRQYRKPEQARKPWVRVCYNCRKPGHLAMCCPKPNPRKENLSANPKPTLAGILKRKLPEPEPRKQAQSLSVGAINPSGKHDRPSLCERPASESLAVASKPLPKWEIEWRANIAAKKAKVQDMMAAVAIAEQQKKDGKVSSLRQQSTLYGSERTNSLSENQAADTSMDICEDC